MRKVTLPLLQQKEKVDAHFQSHASFWRDVYTSDGVYAEIIQDRHTAILDWIDRLDLTPGSSVLEVGCGAGFMAIALAQRGFQVHAIDSSEAMIEQTRQHAEKSEMSDRLSLHVGDVYTLAFENETFDLVIAIGVLPWLAQAQVAIQEMARITKPGGYVILTTANRAGLPYLLDPLVNPMLAPLKQRIKKVLERIGTLHRPPSMIYHSCRFINKALMRAGLNRINGRTHGFGPFSLFRHTVLPERLGTALYHRLQYLTDHHVPVFRSTGMTYIVLARKLVPRLQMQSTRAGQTASASTRTPQPGNVRVIYEEYQLDLLEEVVQSPTPAVNHFQYGWPGCFNVDRVCRMVT